MNFPSIKSKVEPLFAFFSIVIIVASTLATNSVFAQNVDLAGSVPLEQCRSGITVATSEPCYFSGGGDDGRVTDARPANITIADEPGANRASVSGRVTLLSGRGISGAMVSIYNFSTDKWFTRMTNPFGYYRFNDLPVPDEYSMTVRHKRYLFLSPSGSFILEKDLFDMDFTATEDF